MRLLGVIVAVCWLGGCSRFTHTELERRSVQDLFQEAVAISSQHAENTYVPQSNPPPSELLPAELAPTAEPRGPLLVTGPESLPPPPPTINLASPSRSKRPMCVKRCGYSPRRLACKSFSMRRSTA